MNNWEKRRSVKWLKKGKECQAEKRQERKRSRNKRQERKKMQEGTKERNGKNADHKK